VNKGDRKKSFFFHSKKTESQRTMITWLLLSMFMLILLPTALVVGNVIDSIRSAIHSGGAGVACAPLSGIDSTATLVDFDARLLETSPQFVSR
jgi:hypothetical protein